MRPLLPSEITKFLDRFNHFKESEIRALELISPTEIKLTLTAQDKARAFDWITVEFLFSEVNDARLINGSQIAYVDLDDGITLIQQDNIYMFCVGSYESVASIKDSQLYIVSNVVKYREGSF